MNVTQILKIARREYLARVRSRAFIFMTVMIPAFLAAYMFVLPALFSSTGADTLRVALLDTGTGLTDALADRLAGIDRPSIEVTERVAAPDDSDATRARFSEAVRQETIDGYLLLLEDPDIVARASYFARETGTRRCCASWSSRSNRPSLIDCSSTQMSTSTRSGRCSARTSTRSRSRTKGRRQAVSRRRLRAPWGSGCCSTWR